MISLILTHLTEIRVSLFYESNEAMKINLFWKAMQLGRNETFCVCEALEEHFLCLFVSQSLECCQRVNICLQYVEMVYTLFEY